MMQASISNVEVVEAESTEVFRSALLDSDLRKFGKASLPDDINRVDNRRLPGPYVLQVISITDTSQPTRFQDFSSAIKGRILRLKLTDGKVNCVAVEYQPLPSVVKIDMLIPGTKVQLKNVLVRSGVILLESTSFKVLGGRVQDLADNWEVQQKYGGSVERTSADTDKAPPFQQFNPNTSKTVSRKEGRKCAPPRPPPPSTPPSPSHCSKSGKEKQPFKALTPAVHEVPTTSQFKLMERLKKNETDTRGHIRTHRVGRRNRLHDDDSNSNNMTLDEWEAQKSSNKQDADDERFARELQESLNLEDDISTSLQGLFTYDRPSADLRGRGRHGKGTKGRSRGRSRH